MDKVKLHDLERLDIPDANALQDLVYTYCSRFIGQILGQGNWTHDQKSFNRGGVFSKPDLTITHNAVGVAGSDAFKRTQLKVTLGSKFMVYHYATDDTAISVSADDPREVEGHILSIDPSNAQQQDKFDLIGVQDAFDSTGQHPYVWVRPVAYDADTATRRKWSTTTSKEVAVALKTRIRTVAEFAFQADDPGPEWCAIGRILMHKPETAGTGAQKPEIKWFHWSDMEAFGGEIPKGLLGELGLYSSTSTGYNIQGKDGRRIDGLVNQLTEIKRQIARLYGGNPHFPEHDYWHHWRAGVLDTVPQPQGIMSLTRRQRELKELWGANGYAIEELVDDAPTSQFSWDKFISDNGLSDGTYNFPINVTAGILHDEDGEQVYDTPEEQGADGGLNLRVEIVVSGGALDSSVFFLGATEEFSPGAGYGFMANQPGKPFKVTSKGFTAESLTHLAFVNSAWSGTATVGTELKSLDKDDFDRRIQANVDESLTASTMPVAVFHAAHTLEGFTGAESDGEWNEKRNWNYSYQHRNGKTVRFWRVARGTYVLDFGSKVNCVVATSTQFNGSATVAALDPNTDPLNGTSSTGAKGPKTWVVQGQNPQQASGATSDLSGPTAPTRYWLVRTQYYAGHQDYISEVGEGWISGREEPMTSYENLSQEAGGFFEKLENVHDASFSLAAWLISSATGGRVVKQQKTLIEGDLEGNGFGGILND
jgi:hypothetical protein